MPGLKRQSRQGDGPGGFVFKKTGDEPDPRLIRKKTFWNQLVSSMSLGGVTHLGDTLRKSSAVAHARVGPLLSP